MDPVTVLVVAAVLADVLSRGWVHTALIGGVAGSVRETGRQLAWSVPDNVQRSRTARVIVGTGRVAGIGVRSAVRGVRYGGPVGYRSAVAGLPARRDLWRDRRTVVRDRTLGLVRDVRSRTTKRPAPGAPAPAGTGPQKAHRPAPGTGGTGPGTPSRPVPTPAPDRSRDLSGTGPDFTRGPVPLTKPRTGGPVPETGPGTGPQVVPDWSGGSVLTLDRDHPDRETSGPGPGPVPDRRTADPGPDDRRRFLGRFIRRVPDDWRTAGSLHDLGNVTVRWLTGDLPRLPGYLAPVDVDEHLAPGMTDALIRANQAGFVTDTSQGGAVFSPTACQLAWVTGVASPEMAERLAEQARAAGYETHLWRKGDPRRTVTWDRGRPFTRDGWASPRVVREEMFPDLSPEGIAAVTAAQQLSIIDPEPGRNTLWQWLAETTDPSSTQPTTEDPMSIDVALPNTSTEDVPAHVRAGGHLATAVGDVAEQYQAGLLAAIAAHVRSAEGIAGFPASLRGMWEEQVESPVRQAFALLQSAAEGARACTATEDRAFRDLIEATGSAPADASGLTVGQLTPR